MTTLTMIMSATTKVLLLTLEIDVCPPKQAIALSSFSTIPAWKTPNSSFNFQILGQT